MTDIDSEFGEVLEIRQLFVAVELNGLIRTSSVLCGP